MVYSPSLLNQKINFTVGYSIHISTHMLTTDVKNQDAWSGRSSAYGDKSALHIRRHFRSFAVDPGILTVLYGLFKFFCFQSELVKKVLFISL